MPSGIVNDGNGGANYSYTFVTGRRDHQPACDHRHRGDRHQDLRRDHNSTGVPTITAGSLATGDTTTTSRRSSTAATRAHER